MQAEKWSHLAWLVSVTGISCCCTWYTFKLTYDHAISIKDTQCASNSTCNAPAIISGNQRRPSSPIRNRLESRSGSIQTTIITLNVMRSMIETCMTSSLFSISLMIYLVALSLTCFNNHSAKDELGKEDNNQGHSSWYFSSMFIQMLGYTGLLSVYMQRLKVFLKGTSYQIPLMTSRLFDVILSIMLLFIIVDYLVYITNHNNNHNHNSRWIPRMIDLMIYLFLFFIYMILSLYICYQFYHSIHRLTQDNTSSVAGLAMRDVSLKLSILCLCALSSTLVLSIFTFAMVPLFTTLFGQSGYRITLSLSIWMNHLDALINNVTLLLTFQKSSDIYDVLFGQVHRYFLNRLLQPRLVPNISETNH